MCGGVGVGGELKKGEQVVKGTGGVREGELARGTRVPGYQGIKVSGYQGTRVPGYQGIRVPGYHVPGNQSFRVPEYQGTRGGVGGVW